MTKLTDVHIVKNKKERSVEIRIEFSNDRFHSVIFSATTNPTDIANRLEDLAVFIREDRSLHDPLNLFSHRDEMEYFTNRSDHVILDGMVYKTCYKFVMVIDGVLRGSNARSQDLREWEILK